MSAPSRGPAAAAPVSSDTGDRHPLGKPSHTARLADSDFEQLREYVYRRTGIQFAASKRYFVDKRIYALMAESGEANFAGYFSLLRLGDEALIQDLVNALTVNETYFLREDYQFGCLVNSVLPRVLADRKAKGLGREPVRILSLPSSTGEEPYSIAIRLLEDWPEIDRVDVALVAGDIDTRVLAAARAGVYSERSVNKLPEPLLRKYFRRFGDDGYRIVDDLRGAVTFDRINICDTRSMQPYRSFDVIFCRNLLIYFDEMSSRIATENLFGALRPGGYLFLGHSESMSRISSIFTPHRFPDALVYQRPDPGERR